MMSDERLLTVNGVDLCAETFGHHEDPAVFLIGGAGMSMDYWDTDFCEALEAAGRFVIRYDLRDTGRSVTYPPGDPGYKSVDLINDAVGLLDALGVRSAHVAGISMGGGLAQYLASLHPARVASLTLLSTSPTDSTHQELPGMTAALRAHFTNPPTEPDWTDHGAIADYLARDLRAYAGPASADDHATRDLVDHVVRRTNNIESTVKNHSIVIADETPELVPPQLSDLRIPTLVLHGTDDPLFPIAHGHALAKAIPGARLVPMDGVGHEVPPRSVWDHAIPEIIAHTGA